MVTLVRIALRLIEDALRWVVLLFRSTESVHAENLFLRRQLALYIERGVRPHRVDAATRVSLVGPGRVLDLARPFGGRPPATIIPLDSPGLKFPLAIKARGWSPPIPKEPRGPNPPPERGPDPSAA